MRKTILMLLGIVLCMSMFLPAFAAEYEENDTVPCIAFTNSEGNIEQQPMHCLTESELHNSLPNEVCKVISPLISGSEVTPYGLNPPSTSNVWDLSAENYNFSVNMSKGSVYSNYVFTGHQNDVYLRTYDISGNSGSFVGTVIAIRDGKDVFKGNGLLYRGGESSIFVSGLSPDDYIYFYITVNDRTPTILDTDGSYLSTNAT